jgi:hypothetical protein
MYVDDIQSRSLKARQQGLYPANPFSCYRCSKERECAKLLGKLPEAEQYPLNSSDVFFFRTPFTAVVVAGDIYWLDYAILMSEKQIRKRPSRSIRSEQGVLGGGA